MDRTVIPGVIAKDRQRERCNVNNDNFEESTESGRRLRRERSR